MVPDASWFDWLTMGSHTVLAAVLVAVWVEVRALRRGIGILLEWAARNDRR